MNTRNKKSLKAFSLIELSIVLLIIGIIIAGVTQSSRLVQKSKLQAAQTLTESSPVSANPGLLLWLETTKADSFGGTSPSNNAVVTSWSDINPQTTSKLTARDETAVVNTGITYISNGINSLPSLKFTPTSAADSRNSTLHLSTSPTTLVDTALIPVSGAATVFIVYQKTGTGTARTLFYNGTDAATGGTGYGYQTTAANLREVMFGNTAQFSFTAGAMLTSPEIVTFTLFGGAGTVIATGSGSNLLTVYSNGGGGSTVGSPLTLAAGTGTAAAATTPVTRFIIGGAVDAVADGKSWSGLISEIIFYQGVLSDDDRNEVEAYLGKKYGLTVQ